MSASRHQVSSKNPSSKLKNNKSGGALTHPKYQNQLEFRNVPSQMNIENQISYIFF